MQRKAYVSGVAALLLALVAGCSGSGDGDGDDDPKPSGEATTASAAPPGRYRTLPEPCGAVSRGTLDSLLPGINQIADETQRETAYEGTARVTYDTDRRVGCRWKAESATATDRLMVDLERVVSYDTSVSDDSRAEEIFAKKEVTADLPEPAGSASATPESQEAAENPSASATAGDDVAAGGSTTPAPTASTTATGGALPSVSATPTALQPRTLDDLGDEAFLNDQLNTTSAQRTVTVVFRTSNVLVTVQYEEQSATVTELPDSKEMQDRAQKLAAQLADTLGD
ncbi:DUF3558 domain-containing protein [Streptomyces cavernae]|uniref:DUF3558 domain-containing protein n=1 Tax=Streptomyces cavernae TaxID=2259034 RepID=UPI000FEBD7BE|nr:DUF3558 domain-containing protein [Streptomyces cavernae]